MFQLARFRLCRYNSITTRRLSLEIILLKNAAQKLWTYPVYGLGIRAIYFVQRTSLQFMDYIDCIQFFVIVTKMRKAATPNGHWISVVSVTKKSSSEFTINMSPARCGDNLPLFTVLGAQGNGSKDDKSFNFPEFVSDVRIQREQAASPPLTGVFDLSQLDKTVKGEMVYKECFSAVKKTYHKQLQLIVE